MIKQLLLFFFIFLLSHASFSQDTANYSQIIFDRTVIDTGEVKEGTDLLYTFFLETLALHL